MNDELKGLVESLQKRIGTDDCERCIREYQASANFIQNHWVDEVGKQVYKDTQADEAALLDLDKRRNALMLQTQDLIQRLQAIVDDAEATGRRSASARNSRGKTTSHSDSEYYDGDGFSRRR